MPDRQVIRFDGWHNGRQGAIQAVDMTLTDLLRGLGITLEDCRQALGAAEPGMRPVASEQAPPPPAPPVQRAA